MIAARALRRFRGDRGATVALFALFGIVVLVALAPIATALLGVDPYTLDAAHVYAGPSRAHLLGTDDLGRDVLARLLHGGLFSLGIAGAATILSVAIGGALGLLAGWTGGLVDRLFLRATELALVIPRLPLLLILAASDVQRVVPLPFGREAWILVIVVLFGWIGPARLARASAIQLRALDFVTASRALGASELHILRVHVLPHAASPLLVAAAIEAGELLVYESVLSFLGLGVQPPHPSWGALLGGGFTYLHTAPQLVVLPGLLTFSVVAALAGVTEGLRRAMAGR